MSIRHETDAAARIHELAYSYTYDGLVAQTDEWDAAAQQSTVVFGYDNRNRLTSEQRTGQKAYDRAYTYDLGGNRLTKVDATNGMTTTYHYDITDLEDGGQHARACQDSRLGNGAGPCE